MTVLIDVADRAQTIEPAHFGHVRIEECDGGLERQQLVEERISARERHDVEILALRKPLYKRQHARFAVDH